MPSLILGPQALDVVRRYTIGPLKGPDQVRITQPPWNVVLSGSEPLSCRIWRGEGGATLATPTASWLDPSAPTLGLTVTPADLATLGPGRYRIELTATLSGETLACLPADACIDLADAPGSLATSGWLCSIEDARSAHGRAFGLRSDLPDLIEDASRAIEDHCHRTFARADLDERYDGTGRHRLLLRRPPVVSIASVSVDGTDLDNTAGTEWTLDADSGTLYRGDGRGYYALFPQSSPIWYPSFPPVWCYGFRNIRVQYTGGHDTTPGAVRRACLMLVKHLADSTRHTGLYTSERIGDYEYQMAQNNAANLPFVVEALLARHVLPQAL